MDEIERLEVLDNLQKRYESFSISERKIAEFILQNPESAVNCNVSELANASGTSDATIIRFCKHAGYSGYYQLRIILSRELGRIDHTQGMDAGKDFVPGLLQSYATNILSISQNLNDEVVQKCAKMIENCNCIHIVAAGNTTPLAQYMGFRLGRLGIRSTYHGLAEYFFNDIMTAQEKDIVFAISQSGSSKQVLKAVQLAIEKKITTMAIVGYKYSPISGLVDYFLPAIVEEQKFDYSKNYAHLYEMVVIDVLLDQITKNKKKQNLNMDMQEILMSDLKL